MATEESSHSTFGQIVLRAAATARNCAKQFYFADPEQKKSILDSFKAFIAKFRSLDRNRSIKERDEREK